MSWVRATPNLGPRSHSSDATSEGPQLSCSPRRNQGSMTDGVGRDGVHLTMA